jgi:galactose-1-phosphate uridylyltransferase
MTSGIQVIPDQASPPKIANLDALVAGLPAADQVRFQRIFHLGTAVGRLEPPATMSGWLVEHFQSIDAVLQQRVVQVTNLVTLEGALFNELRARRPIEAPAIATDLEAAIEQSRGGPFCRPEEATPADVFGRIRGQHAITASNVAKSDGWHCVVIFDEHHPLRMTAERVADYVDTAQRWARAAHEADPAACYPFFVWNCLWKAGASILHGHAQMTVTRGMHYAKPEAWRQAAVRYRATYHAGYFDDLITVHRSLNLAVEHGTATILPSLTPFKEKETHILAPSLDEDLKSALYRVLRTFIEQLGVQSFNLVLYQPPVAETPEDWSDFPCIFRVLDRGRLDSQSSDIGAMEIFAQSIVSGDPFQVAAALRGEE